MKLIILDRDGVINQDSDAFIKHPDEWHPESGSIEAIVRLKQAGWTVAIATNQSGIARGYYNRAILSGMHQKLQGLLFQAGGKSTQVDWVSFSPYTADFNSPCRKPANGLLRVIANRFDCDLTDMPMVGDTLNDIYAAQSMKMQPFFVRTGKGERILQQNPEVAHQALAEVPIYSNLLAVVEGAGFV